MIRVNLISSIPISAGNVGPLELGDGIELGGQQIQRQGMIKLLILLIFPLALVGYEMQNIPQLRSRLSSKNALLKTLTAKNEAAKSAVDEIAKFKEDQARLQRQIDTLEGLSKDRMREVKILDNLHKDIPEKVWLTKLEFADTSLKLSGGATIDSEISTFMENLGRSVFLTNVSLVRSGDAPDKANHKVFDIICAIDRPSTGEVKR